MNDKLHHQPIEYYLKHIAKEDGDWVTRFRQAVSRELWRRDLEKMTGDELNILWHTADKRLKHINLESE